MRERRRITKTLKLQNLHHKINRRAYLMSLYNEQYQLWQDEQNWLIAENHLYNMWYLNELLDELIHAKVGDELSYYIMLK